MLGKPPRIFSKESVKTYPQPKIKKHGIWIVVCILLKKQNLSNWTDTFTEKAMNKRSTHLSLQYKPGLLENITWT